MADIKSDMATFNDWDLAKIYAKVKRLTPGVVNKYRSHNPL